MINGGIHQYYEINPKWIDIREHRNKQSIILNLDYENDEFYSKNQMVL